MNITILGTESLGVRGLSCLVDTGPRRILIDPGIALGYMRHGLLPHPFQVAVGAGIKKTIIHHLKTATDVVVSHFHGDHIPLRRANPFQLSIAPVADDLARVRIHAPGRNGLPGTMLQRRLDLEEAIHHEIPDAPGLGDGPLRFSTMVPHGMRASKQGTVMMTRIQEGSTTFVHASDIQLLDREPIDIIRSWRPTIVMASGPPLYLNRSTPDQESEAWNNAVRLAENADILILDHHLLRCDRGITWLERLAHTTGGKVVCAATFMHARPCFLEAWRGTLYREMPIPDGWHAGYAAGDVTTQDFTTWKNFSA
ncbi:MBL fold metallo-hydrolase [Desulfoplanes sp.]